MVFQSSGVLAVVPSNGVRVKPPRSASAGSSGTAVVARKLARLCLRRVTHSSGVLLIAVGAIRNSDALIHSNVVNSD